MRHSMFRANDPVIAALLFAPLLAAACTSHSGNTYGQTYQNAERRKTCRSDCEANHSTCSAECGVTDAGTCTFGLPERPFELFDDLHVRVTPEQLPRRMRSESAPLPKGMRDDLSAEQRFAVSLGLLESRFDLLRRVRQRDVGDELQDGLRG